MKKYTRLDLHKLILESKEGYDLVDYIVELQENSISKNKIKDKIEELKKEKYILSSRDAEIILLQELLEEK